MKKELICIVCPMGCNITVEEDQNKESGYKVRGNNCSRGATYGIKEMTDPRRVLTSTVKVQDNKIKRLPVRTDGDIPKALLFECMKEINRVEVRPPVTLGDIIIENILDTGINVIATKTIL